METHHVPVEDAGCMYCPYCGTALENNQRFCHRCGESQLFVEESRETNLPGSVAHDDIKSVGNSSAENISVAGRAFMKGPGIMLLSAIITVIICIIIISVSGLSKKVSPTALVAIKDSDLIYCESLSYEPALLEEDIICEEIEYNYGSASAGALMLLNNCVSLPDGSLAYLAGDNSGEWVLIYYDASTSDSYIISDGIESELLHNNAGTFGELTSEWKISEDGRYIYYIKDMTLQGGTLCRWYKGENIIIASGCLGFDISPSGERLLWLERSSEKETSLYIRNFNNTRSSNEIVCEHQIETVKYTDNFETVFCLCSRDASSGFGELYLCGYNRECHLIDESVDFISDVSDEGNLFYSALDSQKNRILYLYEQGETAQISGTFGEAVICVPEYGYIIYADDSSVQCGYYLYANGMTLSLRGKTVYDAACSADGEVIYIVMGKAGDNKSLYKCDIGANRIEEPRIIAAICTQLIYNDESDMLFYTVDSQSNPSRADLYCYDGKKSSLISDNAYPMVVYDGNGAWAFFTDVSLSGLNSAMPNSITGTLNLYSNGKVSRIHNDVPVVFWNFTSEGIVYIRGYSDSNGGILCLYNSEGITRKISVGVQGVISRRECLDTFGW